MTDTPPTPLTNADSKRQRQAEAVVEAHLTRDIKKTAKKYGISERTLFRWMAKVGHDPALTEVVSVKKAQVSEGWADEIPGAMRGAINFLREAAEQGDRKNPEMVRAVAGSLKMLSETAATWKVLDVKLNAGVPGQAGPVRAQAGQAAAGAGRSAAASTAATH